VISGFKVEYSVGNVPSGDDTMQRMAFAFERAGDNVVDMGRYVFPKLVPVFEAELTAQFDARGRGPHAGAWAQLSERYAAWKSLNYPGAGILERSGNLREALTSTSSPFALRDIQSEQFDFGTRGVEYASFHQTGTDFMVDRPPFDFSDDFERQAKRAAAQGVREAVADARADEFLTVEGD
jgi:phage gpG-like protein